MMDIAKYQEWVEGGRRSVEIKLETFNKYELKVWCYDYDLEAGEHISLGDDPPTDKYLRQAALERTERRRKELLGELEGLG